MVTYFSDSKDMIMFKEFKIKTQAQQSFWLLQFKWIPLKRCVPLGPRPHGRSIVHVLFQLVVQLLFLEFSRSHFLSLIFIFPVLVSSKTMELWVEIRSACWIQLFELHQFPPIFFSFGFGKVWKPFCFFSPT